MKSKKALFTAFAIAFSAFALFFLTESIKVIRVKNEIYSRLRKIPSPPLFDLDSLSFSIPASDKIVLIYINSECDFCKKQVDEIASNVENFAAVKIVFISTEPISKIKTFLNRHSSLKVSNVYFSKINNDRLFDYFGNVATPTIWIYRGALLRQFKQLTSSKAILKAFGKY
jgi:hypothetical protein